ncbi:sugar transferase [Actinomycetospora succinea]|uniref:sugar transferase n=1 Tax=Actinomycetospora succinea TaxID=663603 RepID=UPI00105B43D3|nr:sugar transferase [Actinomycetospora succinea]
MTVLLVTADLVATAVAFSWTGQLRSVAWALAGVLAVRVASGLYRTRLRFSYAHDLGRAFASVAAGFAVAVAGATVLGTPHTREIAIGMLVFLTVSEIGRGLVLTLVRHARRDLGHGLRTVVVGSRDVGLDVFSTMRSHPELGLLPVAVADPARSGEGRTAAVAARGPLADVIEEHHAQAVLLAQDDACSVPLATSATIADGLGCSVLYLRRASGSRDGSDVERLRALPVGRHRDGAAQSPSRRATRAFDLIVSTGALVFLLPLIAIVALAVRLECGSPVIARRWRVGRAGEPFRLLTFTSTVDDGTIGPVGRVIRGTWLDELPQLWNVLCGDMSLLGPRPGRSADAQASSADRG